MTQEDTGQLAGLNELLDKVNSLELRISRIEEQYESTVGAVRRKQFPNEQPVDTYDETVVVDKGLIESNIFEYGLAWFGSLVLLFGIVFLSNFVKNYMNGPLASLFVYAAVAGVFFLAWYLRDSYSHLSFMLDLSAHLLVYYVTLRLYFFSVTPVIPAKGVVVGLLIAVTAVQCWLAIRRKSELRAGISLFLSIATALFTDTALVSLPLMILTAAFSFFLFMRYGWWRALFFTLVLVYVSQGSWLLGNPIMGNPVGASATHSYNLVCLLIYGTIFSIFPMIKHSEELPDRIYSAAIIINGLFFTTVLLFVVASFYPDSYVWIFSMIFLICLVYSIFLKYRINRLFDSAFFAIYSFMALSIAVYGYSKLPDALWLLALQSLLVVSWALWFRSKIILVMNTFLFIGILVLYMTFYPAVNKVNIAFVITAFISARVINWKKERLTLKTEMLRNTYLIALFLTMLFMLYHLVPKQYVTLSWTGAAVFYFIMSLILKNIKYRWMAIAAVLVTGFYLFFVDLSHLETGYRVLAFLFLAVISLGASLYFTKQMRKNYNAGMGNDLRL